MASTWSPRGPYRSRHSFTRGMASLQSPQETAQKWTKRGRPGWMGPSVSVGSGVLSQATAPSREGRGLRSLKGIGSPPYRAFSLLAFHMLVARPPAGPAEATRLKGLEHPQGLLHAPPHRVLVDHLVADDPLGVDDEESPQGCPRYLVQHAVAAGNLVGGVAGQGVVDGAQPLQLPVPRGLDPGPVDVDRIDAAAQDVAVERLELFVALAESPDLSGADEGKIGWVKEEDQPSAPVILEANGLVQLLQVLGAGHLEDRRGLPYQGHAAIPPKASCPEGPRACPERPSGSPPGSSGAGRNEASPTAWAL